MRTPTAPLYWPERMGFTSGWCFLDRLLAAEAGERWMRRIRTSLRLSGLPPGLTLGGFDFAFQP